MIYVNWTKREIKLENKKNPVLIIKLNLQTNYDTIYQWLFMSHDMLSLVILKRYLSITHYSIIVLQGLYNLSLVILKLFQKQWQWILISLLATIFFKKKRKSLLAIIRKQSSKARFIKVNWIVWFIKGSYVKFTEAHKYESGINLVLLQGSVEITKLHEYTVKIWPCNSKGKLNTQCLDMTNCRKVTASASSSWCTHLISHSTHK
jgi:hypothetical protein